MNPDRPTSSTPGKTDKRPIRNFVLIAGFIVVGLIGATTWWKNPSERQQLDALLQPLEDPDAMTTPFDHTPFTPWEGMNQSMENMFAQQQKQMQATMQAMQKQMQASKPYTLTSDDKAITLTIPLKDKNDALNYQVDVQPNGFVVQYRHQSGFDKSGNKTGQAGTQTQMQSFMESFPEALQADKATQVVRNNQLIVTIPKAADTFQRGQSTPKSTQVYQGTQTPVLPPEDAI
jgi:HSP20 family molecular chaperone IbpA